MNLYETEVQEICCHANDETQGIHRNHHGILKVDTVCHGYYVIPKYDVNYPLAKAIGTVGKLGAYLEEDFEAQLYINALSDYALMQEIMINK